MTAKEIKECLEFIEEYLNIEEKELWKELNEIATKLQDKGLSTKQIREDKEYIAASARWGEAWIIKNDLGIKTEDKKMKLYEKMRNGENMSWCKPYQTKDGKVWLIEKENTPEELIVNGVRTIHPNEKALKLLAEIYNKEYYETSGGHIKPDAILIDAMEERGCKDCPDRNVCDLMGELKE